MAVGGTNGLCLVRGFVVAAGRRRSVYLPRNYYSSSPRKRGPIRPSLAQLWIPACAHYCPEYFLMIGCKLLLALGGVRDDCPDDSIFVTPAKAGVQCLSSNEGS